MVRNRKLKCRKYRCYEELYLGGLCKRHYEEQVIKEQRREEALLALWKFEIEGLPPRDPELHNELLLLRKWWDKACFAVNHDRVDTILADEAPYAVEWCISLAQEIVDAEKAIRNGNKPSFSLEMTRQWVWERFHNLEAGLMSNGIKRSK